MALIEAVDAEPVIGKPQLDLGRIEAIDQGGRWNGAAGFADRANIMLIPPDPLFHRKFRTVFEQLFLRPYGHSDLVPALPQLVEQIGMFVEDLEQLAGRAAGFDQAALIFVERVLANFED